MRNRILSPVVAAMLLSGIVLVSCKDDNNKDYYAPREIIASADVPSSELHLKPLNVECFGVKNIVAVDSMIVAFTNDKQAMIKVFDYSGNTIANLSPSGRAGNEFVSVYYDDQNTVIDGDRYLYVGDQNGIYLYNLSGSIRNGANLKPTKVIGRPDNWLMPTSWFNAFFRNDGSTFQYTGLSWEEQSYRAQLNADGTVSVVALDEIDYTYYTPQYVLIGPDSTITKYDIYNDVVDFKDPFLAQSLYNSHVRISDDGNKIVSASCYQDRMTFIDLESGDVFGVRCQDYVDYSKLADISDAEELSRNVIEGAMQVAMYDKYIFVLYNHNTRYEDLYQDKTVNTTIRIFTWDGRYTAQLVPDAPITNIAIDGNRLIAIDYDEHFYIADITL